MLNSFAQFDEDEDLWDDESDSIENSYLIVKVNSSNYAIKLEKIREIIKLPETQDFPEMREFDRGFIKLRNEIVRIVDLRKKLRIKSISEEENDFLVHISDAKQAHIDWMNELKLSVLEDRQFKLTSDPHKCKFGIWYDSFKSSNQSINLYLRQLDLPHKIIHKLAEKVETQKKLGQKLRQIELIEEAANNELVYLLQILDSAGTFLKEARREIAVIFSINNNLVGCTADGVLNIIEILPDMIEPASKLDSKDYVAGIAKTKDGVILILEEDKLI
jgi:purine-binding chemotaxis protein CheW